jgi:DNA-binding NarL/FixJ family response regulator
LNAKGVTIHSQFLLPLGTFLPVSDPSGNFSGNSSVFTQNTLARKHPLNAVRKRVLREIDLLVIDEVSMLRADVLDAIDYRMRSVKRNFSQSFGGVQVLMIGDLFQLPPVVKEYEWQMLRQYYHSAFFFDALALNEGFVYIELEKIFRQKDQIFLNVLNNLRNNQTTKEDIQLLNEYYKSEEERKKMGEIVTLTTHNSRAGDLNKHELSSLKAKSEFFDAVLDGDFPESMYPVDFSIELKEGAQIMFIKNDSSEGNYFNGKLATVRSISNNDIHVVMAGETRPYKLKKERWENKKYSVDEHTKELEENIVGSFSQYPVKLAWAITVHKSQGLTFDKAIVDVGKAFAPGQVYVALSRLRSLDGLVLGTRIDPSVISNDSNVLEFSKRKESQPALDDLLDRGQNQYLKQVLERTFDFSLLLRQTNKHSQDAASDFEFEDEGMRNVLNKICEKLSEQLKHGNGFRAQLLRLLQKNERELLLERIELGSNYFESSFSEMSFELIKHIEEVNQFSRTKTYLAALDEIDQLLFKQLIAIKTVRYLTECILNGDEIKKPVSITQQLLEERKKKLELIQKELKENPKNTKRKSGRKRKTKSGETKPKKEKGETYNVTFELFTEGKTIKEIAEIRSMAQSTIEGHIARLIGQGKIDIDAFIPKERSKEIAKALSDTKNQKLSDLHKSFNGKYTYGELKMVQSLMRGGDSG